MYNKTVKTAVETAMLSALICVCSLLYIPMTVPITMQTFAVFFAMLYLGGRGASLAVLIYIAIGALGVPVFSGFSGGIGRLFDMSGGFIFGFLFASLVFWLLEKIPHRQTVRHAAISMSISLVIIYIFGTVQYSLISGTPILSSFLVCAVPFIIPDIIKISLAYTVSRRLKKGFSI